MTVVDEFEVGQGYDLFLRQLFAHPSEHLLAGDVVALYDTTDAHFQRCGNYDDTIHEARDPRLVHNGTFKPLQTAGFEVAEHGRVYDTVDGG